MNKKIALALTTAAMIGVAAPAFASSVTGPFGNGTQDQRDFQAWSVLTNLQHKGIAATRVEEWGGYVRAYVDLPDGSQQMEFFNANTLQQVHP